MSKLSEILEQVFTYGVGTNSEDIKGNDSAYLNLQKHAVTKAEQAINAYIAEVIGDMEVVRNQNSPMYDGPVLEDFKQVRNVLRKEQRERARL